MSIPLDEKTSATKLVPLDHLAAHPDPGYEGLERGQAMVPHTNCWLRLWNVWSSSGASMPCKPDQLIGDDDRVAVDDLGGIGEANGARLLNIKIATRTLVATEWFARAALPRWMVLSAARSQTSILCWL